MTTRTPGEVCKELDISPSTLRKYSILFEKEGIIFERNKNNSRLFTVTEVSAMRSAMTASQNGTESLENAVKTASLALKRKMDITQDDSVTKDASQRHDVDATAVMIKEIQSLREEIRKRDSLFVEVLEDLQNEIKALRSEREERLVEAPADEPDEKVPESNIQDESSVKKQGFWKSLFKK